MSNILNDLKHAIEQKGYRKFYFHKKNCHFTSFNVDL